MTRGVARANGRRSGGRLRIATGGRTAVAASTALMVGSLVGGTLYISSTRSESLQVQLSETCLADAGTRFVVTDDEIASLSEIAAGIPHATAPIITRAAFGTSFDSTSTDGSPTTPPLNLMARDGQLDAIGRSAPLADGEVLLPEWYLADGSVAVGDRLTVRPPRNVVVIDDDGSVTSVDFDGEPLTELVVAGAYPSVPVRPEPSFWCGWRDAFRPNDRGDPPPPLGLVTAGTLGRLPTELVYTEWESRPDPRRLRVDQARTLVDDLSSLRDSAFANDPVLDPRYDFNGDAERPPAGVVDLITRAERAADFVARTIAPVRYAAAFAALVLLVGAGVLVVREQRRELRLRALRGVGPVGLAVHQLRWLVPTTVAGAVTGGALAFVGVRVVGPTPEIEPRALIVGTIYGVAGWLVATLVAASVIGGMAAAMVDARVAHRRLRIPLLPELVVVALAVWSYRRLAELGGVRQVGADIRGGDLLAQAFPLLSAVAVVAVMARPLRWLVRRARGTGTRLPVPVLLGWRRVTAEPTVSVTVGLSTALAMAFAVQATSLTDSVEQLLADKARVFVGSDQSILTVGEPTDVSTLGSAATVVTRVEAEAPRSVEILGVDRATFEAAAFWRADASDRPLAELLRLLEPVGEVRPGADDVPMLPAVVIGGELDADTVTLRNGELMRIDPIEGAEFFPGYRNATVLVVVDRPALLALTAEPRTEIWIRDPAPDAVNQVQALDVAVRGVRETTEVFTVSSFLSTRWGYASFTALGVMIGLVTLLGQLLVLDARRSTRRVAHVLTRRMGLGRRSEALAVAVEVAVPMVGGALLGTGIGWGAARLAAARLDSLRNLRPPAVLVVDTDVFGVATVVVLAVVGLLALVGLVGLVRTRAMEVMRAVSN